MNWRKNPALASEAEIVFDLVEIVTRNMRRYDEGKIKTHADCFKMCKLLTADKFKACKLAGDGGSVISKIIEL